MKTFQLSQQRTVDLINVLDNLPKDAITDNKTYRLRNNTLNDLEEQSTEYNEKFAEYTKRVQEWLVKERKDLDEIDTLIAEEKDKVAIQALQNQKQIIVNALNKKIDEKFKKDREKLEEEGRKEKTFKLGNEKFDTTKKLFDEYGFKLFNSRKAWGEIDAALEGVKTVEE